MGGALVARVSIGAVPLSTYRVQFGPHFGFRDGTGIVPYLDALGIDYLYASPYFRARPGSEHGYDATDPTRIDPDLGSEEDFYALQDELRKRGMGIVLD